VTDDLPRTKTDSPSIWVKLAVLLLGVLSYPLLWAYGVGVDSVSNVQPWLYPFHAVAVGVFVGYLLRPYGWLYAMLPVIAVALTVTAFASHSARILWLSVTLPVGLACSAFGGFVGERLVRT
jgi:hypothetical protein